MNEKYANYLKQGKLIDAAAEFGNAGYDLDDSLIDEIYGEWANACSDLVDEIFKRHPEIVEELKNEE